MKFQDLELQNFGKFHNNTVTFHEGINLLSGPNETGKTTVYQAIRGMLFGIEKQRGRARHDLYTTYEPWENPAYYAGMLRFERDGKAYRIERSFGKNEKRVELVCETTGEVLPEEAITELLGGINNRSYTNTMSIGQMAVEPDESLAKAIRNYAANYCGTGNGEVDVVKAAEQLKGLQKDASRDLTLYLTQQSEHKRTLEQQEDQLLRAMDRNQYEIRSRNQELLDLGPRSEEFIGEQETIRQKQESLEAAVPGIQEQKEACQMERARVEERHQAQLQQQEERMAEYEEEVAAVRNHGRRNRKHGIIGIILGILLVAAGLLFWKRAGVMATGMIILWAAGSVALIFGIIMLAVAMRLRLPAKPQERTEQLTALTAQAKELTAQLEEYEEREDSLTRQIKQCVMQRDALSEQLRDLEGEGNRLKGQIVQIEAEMREQAIELTNLREQMAESDAQNETRKALEIRNDALKLAEERIKELTSQLRAQLGTRLNEAASAVLADITCGKYESLLIDEKLDMHLNTPRKRIPVESVSRGTIEQIYLALRMAALEILFDEEMPVILDDALVFYDEERLGNTLRWLALNKKQVLIFSCQNREEQILREKNIPFTKIEIA